jgi:hypothetical protein
VVSSLVSLLGGVSWGGGVGGWVLAWWYGCGYMARYGFRLGRMVLLSDEEGVRAAVVMMGLAME